MTFALGITNFVNETQLAGIAGARDRSAVVSDFDKLSASTLELLFGVSMCHVQRVGESNRRRFATFGNHKCYTIDEK